MEKKMETTIGIIGVYVGVIFGLYRDNGKGNGSYYIIKSYAMNAKP